MEHQDDAALVERKLAILRGYLRCHFPACRFELLARKDAVDYFISFVHDEKTYRLQIGRPVMENPKPSPEEFGVLLETYAVAERLKVSPGGLAVWRP